jgi:nitronate monooxygenase
MPLRAKGEADFSNLWAGQAFTLGVEMSTAQLTRKLADEGLARLINRVQNLQRL